MNFEAVILASILVVLTATIAGFVTWLVLSQRQTRRDQWSSSIVASAGTLLEHKQEAEAFLRKLNLAAQTLEDALRDAKALKSTQLSLEIKRAIELISLNYARLKTEYGKKVETVSGAVLFVPDPAPATTTNNKQQPQQSASQQSPKEAASNIINEAAATASAHLGRKVDFGEIWALVKTKTPNGVTVNSVADFAKLDNTAQKGIIDVVLLTLAAARDAETTLS